MTRLMTTTLTTRPRLPHCFHVRLLEGETVVGETTFKALAHLAEFEPAVKAFLAGGAVPPRFKL